MILNTLYVVENHQNQFLAQTVINLEPIFCAKNSNKKYLLVVDCQPIASKILLNNNGQFQKSVDLVVQFYQLFELKIKQKKENKRQSLPKWINTLSSATQLTSNQRWSLLKFKKI